eukprot:1140086-Ditylum_brightwellii.AAC.1
MILVCIVTIVVANGAVFVMYIHSVIELILTMNTFTRNNNHSLFAIVINCFPPQLYVATSFGI